MTLRRIVTSQQYFDLCAECMNLTLFLLEVEKALSARMVSDVYCQ